MYNNLLLFFFVFCVLVLLAVFWMLVLSSKKYKIYREKSSSFECGYDYKDSTRLPFSLRFFLMIILFVMFDIEICLLINMPFYYEINYFNTVFCFWLFLFLLFLGVMEEFRRGLLYWSQ